MVSSNLNDGHDYPRNTKEEKTITFIRHGCTYMNEYLGGADGGRSFGSPQFTDIFDHDRRKEKYQDSPLSPLGLRQAKAMALRTHDFVTDCELVVISPLTRALQTFDVGLRSHFVAASNEKKNAVPVMALPEAAERLYLISDVGRSVKELQKLYNYVDFETGFVGPEQQHDRDQWWYHPSKNRKNPSYAEWRPVGRGQRYACPAEPLPEFHGRMRRLHAWLDARPERHIALVCHHGVIQSFLDCDFDNCQYRSVFLKNIQPHFAIQPEEILDER